MAANTARVGRRSNTAPASNQQSSQYLGVIGLVFIAFLAWLWLYGPSEVADSDTRRPASIEVRDWLRSNGLESLEAHSDIVGK